MFTNIFESRNKTFINLVKLGDYLGRSLRENVEILSVDDNLVTYLTESGKVIRGEFNKLSNSLDNIQIQDSQVFQDKKLCSDLADKKISNFLADILENDLPEATNSFNNILSLWENKLKFDKTKKRLEEKAKRFNESLDILGTPEFSRLIECTNDLVKILSQNEKYVLMPDIRNTVKLSNVISKSFGIDSITHEDLLEQKSFSIPQAVNSTLYEHLCRQELVVKELAESKRSLDTMWVTNEKIQKLPSYIYESDQNIMKLVAEIISEIPYFAMATKKQLAALTEGNLDLLVEEKAVPDKDIKSFIQKVYEFKKPVRQHFLDVLNEEYGINIENFKDVPTFDSLINTEVAIFEALSKICPKDSIVRRSLLEFASVLSNKNGVESIDISDYLNTVFTQAGYSQAINETSLMSYLNFDRVADDLGKIGQVLKMIQANVGAGQAPAAAGQGDMGLTQAADMMQGQQQQGAMQQPEEGDGEYEPDPMEGGEMGEGDEEDQYEGEDGDSMDAEQAAQEVSDEEDMDPEAEGQEEEAPEVSREDLIDNMKELEELISNLKAELGSDEEDDEMGDEEMGEEGEEHEEPDGDEGMPDINTGDGDDEVHIDSDSHNDDEGEEEEEEEEEDTPKDKGKFPFNKGD
jgi:hypothetical protein